MIPLIAWLIFIVLALVAALHFLWATGSTWPVAGKEQFVRSFIGAESAENMPGQSLTGIVAILILIAALVPLWHVNIVSLPLPVSVRGLALWVLFAIFILRGLSTYALPNLPRAEPFRRLDRHYFAPLCLLISAGFLCLAV